MIFRYVTAAGETTDAANPNGSLHNIAGICNERRNVVALMPHPERACEPVLGSGDGKVVLDSVVASLRAGVPVGRPMTADRRAAPPAAVGRILVVSAIVMFALSLAFWNDALPFLGLSADARPLVAGALLAGGLLDLGLAIVMMRKAR